MIYSVKSKGILSASKLPLNSDKGNTFSIQLSVVKDEKCKKKIQKINVDSMRDRREEY